ncbi:MAG: class I SAM-dependent methyltransferase [Gemmatimonadales bacterium]
MTSSDFGAFVQGIGFRWIRPERPMNRVQASLRARLDRTAWPLDVYITRLPAHAAELRRLLRPLCRVPRMSTFAYASVINRAVATLPDGAAFVNVGVWHGFTFLAGLAGNAEQRCIGVDNFSEFGGPKDAFLPRFERLRSARHEFHEMDYERYFAGRHAGPIGVYLYDGEHSYQNQLKGLEAAERFFTKDCIVLVDDTNDDDPRRATQDFVAARPGKYRTLLDCRTAANGHPTWWNGLMVLRGTG